MPLQDLYSASKIGRTIYFDFISTSNNATINRNLITEWATLFTDIPLRLPALFVAWHTSTANFKLLQGPSSASPLFASGSFSSVADFQLVPNTYFPILVESNNDALVGFLTNLATPTQRIHFTHINAPLYT